MRQGMSPGGKVGVSEDGVNLVDIFREENNILANNPFTVFKISILVDADCTITVNDSPTEIAIPANASWSSEAGEIHIKSLKFNSDGINYTISYSY